MTPTTSLFHEVQRFPRWVLLVLVPGALVAWAAFVYQVILGHTFGSRPGPSWGTWILFIGAGVLLPGFIASLQMTTEVSREALRVAMRPLRTRVHRLSEIASARAITYSPLGDYGGWGIRYGGKEKGWAYNARGNRGVMITLQSGGRLMVGSQRPEELVAALRAATDGRLR